MVTPFMTQFITVEVPIAPSVAELQVAIARSLQRYGDPLRWAITAVNATTQTLQIEAVVTVRIDVA